MKWQYLFLFFVLFSACKKEQLLQKVTTEKTNPITANTKDGVWYNRVQRMPVLKECYKKKIAWKDCKKCSDKLLLETIYSNLKMPEQVECDFSKRVIVQFTIEIDGSISNIRFPRKVAPYFEEEVKRLVCLLPEWQPGNMYGKDVEIQYTLPIRFDTERYGY